MFLCMPLKAIGRLQKNDVTVLHRKDLKLELKPFHEFLQCVCYFKVLQDTCRKEI